MNLQLPIRIASRFHRLLVLGSPGAGKSTLARALAQKTSLPLVHLDQLYWEPGWTEPQPEAFRARLDQALSASRWIMDGNYGNTLLQRLQHADAAIVLDYPTHVCLWRTLRRILATRGTVRADMAAGCVERFDPAFALYVARFRSALRPQLLTALANFQGAQLWLTSPRQLSRIAAFLASSGPTSETA